MNDSFFLCVSCKQINVNGSFYLYNTSTKISSFELSNILVGQTLKSSVYVCSKCNQNNLTSKFIQQCICCTCWKEPSEIHLVGPRNKFTLYSLYEVVSPDLPHRFYACFPCISSLLLKKSLISCLTTNSLCYRRCFLCFQIDLNSDIRLLNNTEIIYYISGIYKRFQILFPNISLVEATMFPEKICLNCFEKLLCIENPSVSCSRCERKYHCMNLNDLNKGLGCDSESNGTTIRCSIGSRYSNNRFRYIGTEKNKDDEDNFLSVLCDDCITNMIDASEIYLDNDYSPF